MNTHVIMLLAALLALPTIAASNEKPNLLANPGFEDGAPGWSIPEDVMQIDTSVAHTGKASLKLSWDKPEMRKLATHAIPAKPGKRYLISAWLKSKDVMGALKGVHFGVEWYSKDAFIGGAYPMGIGYDRGWLQVSFMSGVVPKNAAYAHVFTTLDYGGKGTAWIDDITVTEVDATDMISWEITNDTVVGDRDSAPFELKVKDIALKEFGEEVKVTACLCSPPWNVVLSEQTVDLKKGTVTFPTGGLNPGGYRIQLKIKNQGGAEIIDPETKHVTKRPPVQCLITPHSGVILPGSPYPVLDVKAYRDGVLTGEIVAADGKSAAAIGPKELQAGKAARIKLPGKPSSGRYEIKLALKSKESPDYQCSVPFTVLEPGQAEKGVIIGPDNLLIDKGKPWFPMFVYAHTAYDFDNMRETGGRDPGITKELLDHIQGTPFGILDYATPTGGLEATVAFADECAKRGIRLILSVKDVYANWGNAEVRAKDFADPSPESIVRSLARRLKDHPALALYYTNDELSTMFYDQLSNQRKWLKEEDPLHPALSVHYELDYIRELAPTYDIFGPELYPWPSDELMHMAQWSDKTLSRLPDTAPFWGCLWHFKNDSMPDEKLRALSYLAIAKGARGLLFYAFYEFQMDNNFESRWKNLVTLGREIESRVPILIQPEMKNGCKTKTKGLVIRTVSGKEGTWLLAVNATKNKLDAQITVPQTTTAASENGIRHHLSGGIIRFAMPPFGVRLVKLN